MFWKSFKDELPAKGLIPTSSALYGIGSPFNPANNSLALCDLSLWRAWPTSTVGLISLRTPLSFGILQALAACCETGVGMQGAAHKLQTY